ncbi:hypothetical protein KL86PLE_90646 [uncultured Pleomorphomonas sp.]|uniref:Uncharacterized protein n=1 Tax=uncultured Pleomorphomonas sp. TaxID=442121 RepID=A0A212LQS7_9HYPH|nr:hypothetical protein [uncultured Pleomorphomonas sp.]SCM79800.1 hypothetical protein KL86PLE_90646 [uncultured Pleomorphomonas sp.]
MITLPKAAIEAAASALQNIEVRDTDTFHREAAEAAVLAALPHLGVPAEWQRYAESMGWWQFVAPEDMAHYRKKDATMRPLYLAPPLGEPVAVRYGWDGHGYSYADDASGSDWLRRYPDAEQLYLAPPAPAPAAAPHLGEPIAWADTYGLGELLSQNPRDNRPRSVDLWRQDAGKNVVPLYRSPPTPAPARIVRHKKRGDTYEVVGPAEGQISFSYDQFGVRTPADRRMVFEGDKLTIYRAAEDGKLWWRFPDEFEDGRFEDIKPFDPATSPGHTDMMVDAETLDAFLEANPLPDEAPKISLRDAGWNLLHAHDRDLQAVGYRADLWACLRAILEGEEGAGPSPAGAAGRLAKVLDEAITKVENDRTLSVPEWQTWMVDACAALEAYKAGLTPRPAPVPDPVKEQMAEALRPFAKFAGELSIPKHRFFLQLLVCPEGDDHPENYGPHFQRARAALAAYEKESSNAPA